MDSCTCTIDTVLFSLTMGDTFMAVPDWFFIRTLAGHYTVITRRRPRVPARGETQDTTPDALTSTCTLLYTTI